jgi:hypothetical protein
VVVFPSGGAVAVLGDFIGILKEEIEGEGNMPSRKIINGLFAYFI